MLGLCTHRSVGSQVPDRATERDSAPLDCGQVSPALPGLWIVGLVLEVGLLVARPGCLPRAVHTVALTVLDT